MRKEHVARPEWLSVKEMFGERNGFQFVVPVYQRDYVWNADTQVWWSIGDSTRVPRAGATPQISPDGEKRTAV